MNKDKVYLKGYVIGHAADTLGYQGLMVQLENLDVVEIDNNLVHKKIDEPQKPVVKQFVADWYEEYKDDFEGELFRCVDLITRDFEDGDLSEFEEWFIDGKTKPFQTLVNMHQFGYTVEKEKQYEVILCNGQSLKTVYRQGEDRLDFEKVYGDIERFTRKQLEEAGFGWVFDCEGMEVKEV